MKRLYRVPILGHDWPDTGREVDACGKLEIHEIHEGWLDLVQWDERRKVWLYISTVRK